tara:strand:- start:2487 stop:3527 length:1041 start_codon:yes stop_codon:yes gene_type:complete
MQKKPKVKEKDDQIHEEENKKNEKVANDHEMNKNNRLKETIKSIQNIEEMKEYIPINDIFIGGTHGTILHCRHKDNGSKIVLKKFEDHDRENGHDVHVLREVSALQFFKKNTNPNIIYMFDIFSIKNEVVISLEYMQGSLGKRMKEGSILFDTALSYKYQLASGLSHCHSFNIMHRDIKPDNLLVNDYPLLKICDFGLAKRYETYKNSHTVEACTMWYRPIELFLENKYYNEKVDIWSMACVFWELDNQGIHFSAGVSALDCFKEIVFKLGLPTSQNYPKLPKNIEIYEKTMSDFKYTSAHDRSHIYLQNKLYKLMFNYDFRKRPSALEVCEKLRDSEYHPQSSPV